jgi:hypothetical protein
MANSDCFSLNQIPIYKVRMMLMREQGCPMTVPDIQHTIKRELLRRSTTTQMAQEATLPPLPEWLA